MTEEKLLLDFGAKLRRYSKGNQIFGEGDSAIAIILSSCVGSIAVMLILINGNGLPQMIELFFVVIVCMGYNTSVLSQQKPKFVFNSLLISLSTSLILILINIL